MDNLWTATEIATAIGAQCNNMNWHANGVSIDTRTLQPGDLFIALHGEKVDGAKFVNDAFTRGAAGAISSSEYKSARADKVFIVPDTLKALEQLAAAARARSYAKIIAVTGSVGKTSTKEMLAHVLSAAGHTHATIGNLNNHFGLPLTLARMPRDTEFAVLEMGMNHADEISPLSKLTRPDIAIITTVDAVHLEHFENIEAIADAKAEIFAGMNPGSTAILNRDNSYYTHLLGHAHAQKLNVLSFGTAPECDAQLLDMDLWETRTHVHARVGNHKTRYIINAPGAHWVLNSLSVLLAATTAGVNLETAASKLMTITPPAGRGLIQKISLPDVGEITVIDESYNASPASITAALATLGRMPGRKIAVLGDMLELGPRSAELHAALAGTIIESQTDLLFCCGPMMQELFNQTPPSLRGEWAADSTLLTAALIENLQAGDVVLVKGSNGMKMNLIPNTLMYRAEAA